MVEVNNKLLDKIREWATPPYKYSRRLDEKIVRSLLIACVGIHKLAANEIEDGVMEFIGGNIRNYFLIETIHLIFIFFDFQKLCVSVLEPTKTVWMQSTHIEKKCVLHGALN